MKRLVRLLFICLILYLCLIVENAFAVTTLNCSTILKSGSKGAKVKVLQTELNEVMGCGLKVDGHFGFSTKSCVLSFQRSNSLSQDAIVGPKTCNTLNELYLKSTEEKDEIEVSTDLICSGSTLKNGSSGKQVEYLQEKLNKIMGCYLTIDGKYGSATSACVSKFQTKMGISVTGKVDNSTCNLIKDIYVNRTNAAFNKQGNENTLDCHNSLKKGSRGNNVRLLQIELNEVLKCGLTVDGSFGNGTLSCVKKFQASKRLVSDGLVGASTCRDLNVAYLANNNYIIADRIAPIRKSASTSAKIIATATYGMVFKNYGVVGNFYKIKYNNEYAYVKRSDMKTNAIVVDISNQTLKYYKNGKLNMDSLVITGLKGVHDTPQGVFEANPNGRARNIYLMNNSFVNYWLPFIGSNYGFHDADMWRANSQFYDKTRYTYNGSHGCINMLDEDAEMLYSTIPSKTAVYVVE